MFCTGGIRCEKSTAYLKARGFGDVYHLEGGILNYLEQVSKTDNLWEGECFVFDDRVSVDHDLNVGKYDMCHACRNPISEFEKESEFYKPGVSCPKCIAVKSLSQKERYAERQKQMDLAKKRNQVHLGNKTSFQSNRSS